jgi:hypothetical protein
LEVDLSEYTGQDNWGLRNLRELIKMGLKINLLN